MKRLLFSVIAFLSICGCINAQILLSVSSTPATSCSDPCNGTATVTNSIGGTPPYSYDWNTSPAQQTQTATGMCPGIYTVNVYDSATPIRAGGSATVAVNCVAGSNDIEMEKHVTIFPNPAKNEVSVGINTFLQGKVELIIRDVLGNLVKKEVIEANGYLHRQINISTFPVGIYTIEILNEVKSMRKRLVKQ